MKVPKKKKNKNLWFLDNGCSNHIIGDFSKFSTFTKKDGGFVTFGDNTKGKIIGIGNIGNSPTPIIENALLVDNLKHNLLSISQLYDKGYRVVFETSKCLIETGCSKEVIFVGERKDNVYTIDVGKFSNQEKYFRF